MEQSKANAEQKERKKGRESEREATQQQDSAVCSQFYPPQSSDEDRPVHSLP